jgi:hypothetical protein
MDAKKFLKGSAYVRQADLGEDGERQYVIHGTDTAEFRDKETGVAANKLQLILDDGARLSLNDTNLKILLKAYTADTGRWEGQPVIVWWDSSVQYKGRTTGGLRLRIPKGHAIQRSLDEELGI